MNGTLAMFCVTWLVIASSITEPIADSASQSNWRPAVGATGAVPACCASAAATAEASRGSPDCAEAAFIDAQPVAPHTTTNTV
jgi:hypothetical protein